MRGIAGASLASLFGLLLCFVPVIAGAWFAIRPTEKLLSTMRPLTLGALFTTACTFVLAISNGFVAISRMQALDLNAVQVVGAVFMEGLAPVVLSFACLAVSWFLVALGMRRN